MERDKLRCASNLMTGTSVGTEFGVEKPVHMLLPASRAEMVS